MVKTSMVKPVQLGHNTRMSYSKINEVLELPNLIEIQYSLYDWFIKEGLREVFREISPIEDFAGNLVLEFVDYKLEGKPKYDIEECKERDTTYAAPLKVSTRLINKETGEVKDSDVFMGDFPIMTPKGTFIINGAERVIVSQLVRSPGAYYSEEIDKVANHLYKATLIPNRGAWLELESDANKVCYTRIDRTRKLPATVLLRALGLSSDQDIINAFGNSEMIQNTLAKDSTTSTREALIEIYKRLRPGEPPTEDGARNLMNGLFFEDRRYDMAKVGHYKFNQKLSLKNRMIGQKSANTIVDPSTGEVVVEKEQVITKEIAEAILEVMPKETIMGHDYAVVYLLAQDGTVVKAIGNDSIHDRDCRHILKEDMIAATSYFLNLFYQIGNTDDIDHLGNRRLRSVGELLQNQFRIGLARMERVVRDRMSIQDMEVVTPQDLINIRPVVAAIKEFFGSSQLSQFMDQTNPLSELTHKRRLSALGPGGLSRDRAGFDVRDVHDSHYSRMCPIETPEGPNIGLINSLSSYAKINEYGFIEAPYRKFDKEKGIVTDEIYYLTADEEYQSIIAQANEILDDDGRIVSPRIYTRYKHDIVEVNSNEIDYIDVSPKQVVSVATALIPFLENDDANRALMGANMQRQAVPLLIPESPMIATGMEYKAAKDSGVVIVAKEDGIVHKVSADEIIIMDELGQKYPYNVLKFKRSNQGTCINQRPIVKEGQIVKAGDIIADGPSTDNGELGIGKNILVAFMPWEGYNYEDAILMSERLVKDDVYTSIHIEEYESEARDTKLGPEEITRDIPNVSDDALKNLDESGIIRIGAEVKASDILVGKVTPKGETELSAEERLLRAIFGEKAREVRDTSLRVPHGEYGIIVDVKVFKRKNGDELPPGVNQLVRVYIAQKRKISAGDKMAGRHGNKGVISRIMAQEDMPYMADGTPVDIVLNPLGVPSRMNIGQILETHLGLAAKKLGWKIATPVFDGASEDEIMDTLEMAGYPRTGKMDLYDGRTGQKFENPITVGYMYYLKLAHLVDDKIHARSTGPYSLVTQQPLGGKAQFGGQRFGEMEVWALEAYGAAHILQELLTVKSDDVTGRVATYEAIVKGEPIPEAGIPESFKVLIKEFQSLCLDVKVLSKDSEEIFLKELEDDGVTGRVDFGLESDLYFDDNLTDMHIVDEASEGKALLEESFVEDDSDEDDIFEEDLNGESSDDFDVDEL